MLLAVLKFSFGLRFVRVYALRVGKDTSRDYSEQGRSQGGRGLVNKKRFQKKFSSVITTISANEEIPDYGELLKRYWILTVDEEVSNN